MIGELLAVLLRNGELVLHDPLDLFVVEWLDELGELLRGDQLEQARQAQKLEELEQLLGFSVFNCQSERDDSQNVEQEGRPVILLVYYIYYLM
jgi:hypothetical protein